MAKFEGLRVIDDNEKREIVRKYSEGASVTALAVEHHHARQTVKQILQDAGVSLRVDGRQASWTPERREKARIAMLDRLATALANPSVNTAIEVRLQDALKAAGIGFRTQRLLLGSYIVDILINQAPVVIEADGMVHTHPLNRAKDAVRDAALTEAGYRVFRFTGREINTDATACVQHLIDTCGLTPDAEPVYDIRTSFSGEDHPNWKGGEQEYTCDACGKIFLAQPKHRRAQRIFCSMTCSNGARKQSAETRAKIAAAIKGTKRGPLTPETKAKMGAAVSAALKGKPKTAEHAAKVAAANKGRPVSAETRAKISGSLKRRNASQIKI